MGYRKVNGEWTKWYQPNKKGVVPPHAREPTPPKPTTSIEEWHDKGHVIRINETQVEEIVQKVLERVIIVMGIEDKI